MKLLRPSWTPALRISCCNKMPMHSSAQVSGLVTGEWGLKVFRVRWQHWTSTDGMREQEHCVSVWDLHWRLWLEALIKARTLEGSWIVGTFKSEFLHISFESILAKEQILGPWIRRKRNRVSLRPKQEAALSAELGFKPKVKVNLI